MNISLINYGFTDCGISEGVTSGVRIVIFWQYWVYVEVTCPFFSVVLEVGGHVIAVILGEVLREGPRD